MTAQHQDVTDKPNLWKEKNSGLPDSSANLRDAFNKGSIHGHFRYYFMATDNSEKLSDYYANAAGGGIKFETSPLQGFQFGVSGFFIYNIGSSDFAKKDITTNSTNRYEIALFDVTDPDNKKDIDRLEELFLKYKWSKSQISIGKQLINTSFINLQDGRMRPTEVEGVYFESKNIKNTKIEAGVLYRISPRSTVKWYNIGESIGIYPQGVNIDGAKSNYGGHLESDYVCLASVSHNFSDDLVIKVENLYVDNMMNTVLGQVNYAKNLTAGKKIIFNIQAIRQDAINNGGNDLSANAYIQKGSKAFTFGSKIGLNSGTWNTSLNYNRITSDGRYLMPREWGRDPFFTFMPRERNEGLGDVHAIALKSEYTIPNTNFKTQIGLGYFDLPEVSNYKLNKYGMPSYTQLNIDLRYAFQNFLKGMDMQLLYVIKNNKAQNLEEPKNIINKVDMQNWNFLVNYHF